MEGGHSTRLPKSWRRRLRTLDPRAALAAAPDERRDRHVVQGRRSTTRCRMFQCLPPLLAATAGCPSWRLRNHMLHTFLWAIASAMCPRFHQSPNLPPTTRTKTRIVTQSSFPAPLLLSRTSWQSPLVCLQHPAGCCSAPHCTVAAAVLPPLWPAYDRTRCTSSAPLAAPLPPFAACAASGCPHLWPCPGQIPFLPP